MIQTGKRRILKISSDEYLKLNFPKIIFILFFQKETFCTQNELDKPFCPKRIL